MDSPVFWDKNSLKALRGGFRVCHQSHWLTSFVKNTLYKKVLKTWKTLLVVDN